MHPSHATTTRRLQAARPQAACAFGAHALRQPHIARHWRVPCAFGPRRQFAARVRALYVRIHTFYLKFLQGHT
jgi:hypothetical protein